MGDASATADRTPEGALAALRDEWRAISAYVPERGARGVAKDVAEAFEENDLLTYASAISYQVLFAIVPSLLAALALVGFLDLTEIWTRDVAPFVRENLSQPAYAVVQSTVEQILEEQRGFWLTLGVGLALWQVSGAVRATMGALNRVYRCEDRRSLVRRLLLSLALSVVVAGGIALALLTFHLGPAAAERADAGGAVASIARWPVAVVLLLGVLALLVRFAPADRQPAHWVGVVALAIVLAWIGASVLFGLYVTEIASYGTVFGPLSVVIVLMTYVYLSALVFLGGIQFDALLRHDSSDR